MNRLTPRQRRFVEEILVDRNATQAAIRAGYSERTANRQGSRLLSNAVISRAIAERETTIIDKLQLSQERVLRELEAIAYSNVFDCLAQDKDGRYRLRSPDELTEDQRAAVAHLKVKQSGDLISISAPNKTTALRMLAKYHGIGKRGGAHPALWPEDREEDPPVDSKELARNLFRSLIEAAKQSGQDPERIASVERLLKESEPHT